MIVNGPSKTYIFFGSYQNSDPTAPEVIISGIVLPALVIVTGVSFLICCALFLKYRS